MKNAMKNAIGVYRDKKIVLSDRIGKNFPTFSEENPEVNISEYIPKLIDDVQSVSVRSHQSYTEQKNISSHDLEQYHYVHSKVVALHREKQRTLKELLKQFNELSFVPPYDDVEESMHNYYKEVAKVLWKQKKEAEELPETETTIIELLPLVNRAMVEEIASRYICSASIKFLAEAEAYYESIFETQIDFIIHKNCYRIYLPDLDISAIYNESGMFIDFEAPYNSDRESLHSNFFLGFRN